MSALLLMSGPEQKPVAGDVVSQPEGGRMRPANFEENATAPIERPLVRTVGDARLTPDERVIGLVVAGEARAYQVAAMEGRSRHLSTT